MEKIINVILLEGVNIEETNNYDVYLCHKNFTLNSAFPINYLNPLLQLIINSRNETNMNNPLYLGYYLYKLDNIYKYEELNLIIDNLKIESIINKDIIYEYKNTKNRFPICWLNDDIIKLINKEVK